MTPTEVPMPGLTTFDPDLERRLRDVVDSRPVCEMINYGRPCFRPADGARIGRPCGHVAYSCAQCHEEWTEAFNAAAAHGKPIRVVCLNGDVAHEVDALDWRPL